MKIHSIELDGFGCLVNAAYSLAPGFNIFLGPNEIGKSTLQQAILALLYGFYSKSRRNKEEDAQLERFRPWHNAKFGGRLEYVLDAGNAYRVIRNFDGDLETHLLDALTSRDRSAEYERGKLGRLDFAEKQFGLSYEVFVNTCFVRQADLHPLGEVAQKISETVMNLADTGSRDRSVSRAQLLLENAFAMQVGGERASTKPLPAAKRRLQELEDELARVVQQRERMQSDYLALQANKARAQGLEDELTRRTYMNARAKYAALSARIETAEKLTVSASALQAEIAALAAVADWTSDARDEALRLNQMRLTQHAAAQTSQTTAIAARASVRAIDAQMAPLRVRIQALEPARAIPYERGTQVLELERRWQDARRETITTQTRCAATLRALEAKRLLLPTSASDLAVEQVGLAWLRQHREALQDARAQASQAARVRDAARTAWQTHPQTLSVCPIAAELHDAPTARDSLAREQDRVSYWLARRQLDALEKQLAELVQTNTRLGELTDELGSLGFVESFPLETRSRVLQLETQWRAQRDLTARQAERAVRAREELATLETQAAPLRRQAETLRAVPPVPIERADGIRALQQEHTIKLYAYHDAQTKLLALENQIVAKRAQRAEWQGHPNLLAAPPETLPALHAQWNAARERVAREQALATAAREQWRAVGMDQDQFERLQARLAGVDSDLLAEPRTIAPSSVSKRGLRPPWLAVAVSAVLGGVGLLVFAQGMTSLGGALAIAAAVALASAFWLFTHRSPSAPAPTDARITARGFANLQELQSARAAIARARPLRDQLREAEHAVEQARTESTRYSNQLAALLDIDETALSDEMLLRWEKQLREWRAQQHELALLEKARASSQREVDARQAELDAAQEQWRATLAECGFSGDDLAAGTEAFLARAAELGALAVTAEKLRVFEMQMEIRRDVLNQDERERTALAFWETELGNLFASADIAERDTECALAEYQRRADLAVKRRDLEMAREPLERDANLLLQGASLEQLTTQRDSLRADAARLSARNPALSESTSSETLPELHDQRRNLADTGARLEQWLAAEETLDSLQTQENALCQEVAAQLGIANPNLLTPEYLEIAENWLRVWAQARQDLVTLEAQRELQQRAYESAFQNQEQLAAELRALVSSPESDAAGLQDAVRAFIGQCENRRELERLEMELRAFAAEYQTKQEQIDAAEGAQRALEKTESALRELLQCAGVSSDDLDRDAAEYFQRVEHAQKRAELEQTLDGVERELRAVLGSDSLLQLVNARDGLAPILAYGGDAGWDAALPAGEPEQWEQQRTVLEQERVALTGERAAIETRLQTVLGGMRSLAEIEEEIADLRERTGVLTRHGQALELAQEFLAAAAEEHHRDFLPRLNASVGRSLKFITEGRYQTLSIDHNDFQVRLEIPERTLPVTPEQLSRGAQEQIYLLLRLGLTELMSKGRERLPLILDDPLVNYDRARLYHALDFLAALADESQILLFTKDAEIADWFANRGFDTARHRLHRMGSLVENIPLAVAAPLMPEPPQETPLHAQEQDLPPAVAVPPALEPPQETSQPIEITAATAPAARIPERTAEGAYVAPPQRGERGEPNLPHLREPKLELVCWKREGWWQVGAVLPDDLARSAHVELYQGNVLLSPDYRNDNRWLLESLSQNVVVRWGDGDTVNRKYVALGGASYFVFKLQGRTGEQGRRVQRISRGVYLALVPDTWRRYDALAGEATRNPEPAALEGYRAHFIDLNGDGAHCIAFLDENERLVRENAGAPAFVLVGHRVRDDEPDKGPLFGGSPPRVRLGGNLMWADCQTIQVGQEGRGEGEWRIASAVDPTQAEQSLQAIASQGAGWYFVRFKDADNTLLESLDFRFCRGLEKIVMPVLAPMPGAGGHSAAKIEIHHDTNTFITPADELARLLTLERRDEITCITIPNDPRFDTTRWSIGENTDRSVEIVTRLDRVWWAFADEAQEPTAWCDKDAALTLQDFSAVSEKAFWLRLPAPRWADQVRILFGRETRLLNFRAEEATSFVPLRGFENIARALAFGVYPFCIEIQRGGNTYAALVGTLPVAARCAKCGLESLSESGMLEHVRVNHLGEYLRPLKYEELVNLDPTLPREIYQCNMPNCNYYSTHDPRSSPTSAIYEHGMRKHPDSPRSFQKLQDTEVIRERVIRNLLDADKCVLCGQVLKHPTGTSRWEHLLQTHRTRLYQRV